MAKPRPCGCKGIRSCLVCEEKYGAPKPESVFQSGNCRSSYVYCPHCNLAYPGFDKDDWKSHPQHSGQQGIEYDGVFIQLDFLSCEEETSLLETTDSLVWEKSQSGRRKINFGPKCNFKKRKLQVGDFDGFPEYTQFVQNRFQTVPMLKDYRTVEQCFLDYPPANGASIDPHVDDCWVWGERIVTVNLLSDGVLTMTRYCGTAQKYNLKDVPDWAPRDDAPDDREATDPQSDCQMYVIRIPMPRRSLLVLYGPARYKWEHCIPREDVAKRRVCIAYRELTKTFQEGGEQWELGGRVIERAKNFWDHTIRYGLH